MGAISTDNLPSAGASDELRDAAAPGFLAACVRAYGSLEGLGDIMQALGLEGAS